MDVSLTDVLDNICSCSNNSLVVGFLLSKINFAGLLVYMSVDDLVDSVTAFTRRSPLRHLYGGPFLVLYAVVLYVWVGVLGFDDYYEMGCIAVVGVGIIQVITVLFCHWFVEVNAWMSCDKATKIEDAEVILVKPMPNNGWPELVPLRKSYKKSFKPAEPSTLIFWFEFQKVIYRLDENKKFSSIGFPVDLFLNEYRDSKGLESDDALAEAKEKYNDNQMAMELPSFAELFKERATAPFFVFQVFTVGLWCLDEMWYYSLFTLAMLVVFEATLVKQQMRNMSEIRNMGNKPYPMLVYRNKRWSRVNTDQLVAGRSKDEQTVPCDLLLLRGPCIVDESMLTGESVPQLKEPIEDVQEKRPLDMDVDGRLHVLFGGTKVVQHTPPPKNSAGLKATDNGCVCYVLRTGFNTAQGRLLRTILFGVKRVTANNLETFGFILFLLIFAIAASAYVWIKGTEDPDRNRYKLFLECTLILTSVIPPELPIELSLAVNNSLVALHKLGVFCTEPFRIPFAGKVDVCCFDKTGTLTTDNLLVEGVAGINGSSSILPLDQVPPESIQVLVSCHALACLDSKELVGDPLEKACLTSADWTLTKNDAVMPPKSVKMTPLKIFHRWHFSSSLKRMAVIAGYQALGSSDTTYIAAVKGAPETIKSMLCDAPSDYDTLYQSMARQGSRVLALAYKKMGNMTHQEMRDTPRETVESELTFAGFVAISCPLKSDSKAVIREIIDSTHRVVMITGDNALTACHVAKVLRFTRHKTVLILDDDGVNWRSIDEKTTLNVMPDSASAWPAFFAKYDFCLTGPALESLLTRPDNQAQQFLGALLPYVRVFARMAPKQKEKVITQLNALGHTSLMCGDGTNDVGALKHAHVGVALLSHPAPSPTDKKDPTATVPGQPAPGSVEDMRRKFRDKMKDNPPPPGSRGAAAQAHMEKLMAEMEAEERAQVVRLGDASIAAPFTSKYTSIQSICDVIKQGRCTLVTTLQMFKILALNALVLAYSQSVLYLDGIKFSDTQATIQGVLLAACFLFIARSKPLKTLSRQRPLTNIFNLYTLLTVTCQFAVHLSCLLYLSNQAHKLMPPREKVDLEEKFQPSLLNTTVYIMSVALQVSTFAVNYRGRPFMESLIENKWLLYSVFGSGAWITALASGVIPEMSQQFELVPLPEEFRNTVLMMLAVDLASCFMIDRTLNFAFGDTRYRPIE